MRSWSIEKIKNLGLATVACVHDDVNERLQLERADLPRQDLGSAFSGAQTCEVGRATESNPRSELGKPFEANRVASGTLWHGPTQRLQRCDTSAGLGTYFLLDDPE